MKTPFMLLAAVVAARSLLAASSTDNAESSRTDAAATNHLDLSVLVWAGLSLFRTDAVAGAMARIVETRFKQDGFDGQIAVAAASDERKSSGPTLVIDLIDWRVTPSGFVECIFGADLKTTQGRQNLGLFAGTSLATVNSFDRCDPYNAAATDAIDNLYVGLREMNLLPASVR